MVLGVQKHNEVNEYLVAQLRNSKILLSSEKAKRKLKVFQSRTLETNVAFEFFCRVPYFDIPLYTPKVLFYLLRPHITKLRTGKVTRSKTYRTMVQAAEEHHMQCHAARVPKKSIRVPLRDP